LQFAFFSLQLKITADGKNADSLICTVDLLKKDSEIKVLIGCNEEEKQLILEMLNNSVYMKGILIRRGSGF
jgi:inorganic pyrophosphatase